MFFLFGEGKAVQGAASVKRIYFYGFFWRQTGKDEGSSQGFFFNFTSIIYATKYIVKIWFNKGTHGYCSLGLINSFTVS